jgi:ABC-type sugar transport system substrate-binding protein
MKKIIHWVLTTTLCICGASVFTSCTSSNDNPVDAETGASGIVMIGKLGQVEYWQQVESAFRTACEEADVEGLYYTTTTENAYQEQVAAVEQLKQLTGKRLKGIVYAPAHGLNGESADAEVAAYARQRGIPVVILDTPVKAGSPLAGCPYFGTDNAASGRALAAEVKADRVAVFAMQNGAATERAEAFKAVKTGATVYPVSENANSDVEAVINDYDDFVFFNGSVLSSVLNLLKEKGKNVYTFDVYGEFLDELIAGNAHFKGIMAQNTFGMTRKAVDAIMAGAQQGETVPAFFITWDNLGDDAVKPFLDFYGKEAYPPIDGLAEKLVGKWMLADINGKPAPTNNKFVVTFTSAGRGYKSASLSEYADTELKPLWSDRQEFDYAIADNVVTTTSKIDDHLTVVDELTVASISDAVTNGILKIKWIIDGTVVKSVEETVRTLKVTDDYSQTALGLWEGRVTSEQSEYDDGEEHRWELKADGTYTYYSRTGDGQWVDNVNSSAAYFIAGPLLCMRWKNFGDETEYREWWEIESIQDGVMKWKALRLREDGSTYTATFQMTKVE